MSAPLLRCLPCCHCGGTGKIEFVNPAWLRERRLAAGVSLRAMARKLSHSPPYVSDVERGKRNVPRAWVAYYRTLAPQRPEAGR